MGRVFGAVLPFFVELGTVQPQRQPPPSAMDICTSNAVFQRFVALGRTYWLVSRAESTRFAGLGLDTSRLPPSEAALSVRDWHAAASPWSLEFGAPHDRDALLSLTAAIEEDRVRVYEQRRPSVHNLPLEATDLTEMLEPSEPEIEAHWVEVRLVDEHGEPRAGEPYRVLLGDRTELEGRLDQAGVARIPGVPRGPCEWFFPSLAPNEWTRA